jgi:hypothetical protein
LGHSAFDLTVKGEEFVGLIAREARVGLEDEDVVAGEADLLILQGEQAVGEQTGSEKKNERERDLQDDEDVAASEAMAAEGRGVGRSGKTGREAAEFEGWKDTEEKAGEEGEAEREGQDVGSGLM